MNAWDIKYLQPRAPSEVDVERWLLWKKMSASDFYFGFLNSKDDWTPTMVFICPVQYFERNKVMIRESMPINELIPSYMTEVYRSIFEVSKYDEIYVAQDLRSRGFKTNKAFNDHIQNRFDLNEDD